MQEVLIGCEGSAGACGSDDVDIKRLPWLDRGMSGSRRIAGRTCRPKGGNRDLAATAADVDAADGWSTRRNVSGAARACAWRDAASRARIGTVFCASLSCTGARSIHPAAGSIAMSNAGASTSAAQAGLVCTGGRHGQQPSAAGAGKSNFGARLAGNHSASASATATAGGRSQACASVQWCPKPCSLATQARGRRSNTAPQGRWWWNDVVG